jgi:hypothetical protein
MAHHSIRAFWPFGVTNGKPTPNVDILELWTPNKSLQPWLLNVTN